LFHLPEPVILVASAEFTLKSSPVRRTLEQRLIDDLKFALSRAGFSGFRIEKHAARLVVCGLTGTTEAKVGARSCSGVFGVAYAAPATLLSASEEAVLQSIVQLANEKLESSQSFAIRAHRSEPGSLSRRDIELKGGSLVLHALKGKSVTVDLKHPDVTFHVDLVGEDAYVYCEKLQGPGGLPLSAQWKMLAVLDSGPLTVLAAYSMMRRGCLVELFIPLSNINSAFATEDQLNLARNLRRLVTRPTYRVYTVNYDQLIGDRLKGQLDQSALSKFFVRLAAAKFAKEKRFKGIIFADVAGEIGPAGALKAAAPDVAVFTPLIGLTRADLTELAKSADVIVTEYFQNADFTALNADIDNTHLGQPEVQVEQVTL
jgi:thiamine biosynthesis protein ThiI